MPDRFFLNALNVKNRNLEAPNTRRWRGDETSNDFLNKYADDIQIEGQIQDNRVAHSTPSVFARPIQFFQALSNNKNPLHDRVVSQWRGLLAVFALQNQFSLSPTVKEYKVPSTQEPEAIKGLSSNVGDQHITTILRNQLPYPASDWERWWLLYCDNQLIGATSPWTIVYTPAEYICPSFIPWQHDGLLIDPIAYFDSRKIGNSQELALLLRWVELVLERHQEKKMWGIEDRLNEKIGAIKRELETWATDLKKYRDSKLLVSDLDSYPLISETPYCHFLLSPEVEKRLPDSDLTLKTSKIPTTLVFSRSERDLSKRVYGPVFLDQVDLINLPGPIGKEGWKTKNGREVNFPYVIAEEAFLPPKLVELKLFNSAFSRGTNKFAVPLTPLFFKYFDHETLIEREQMLTVSETQDHILVRLRLPLANNDMLTVEKTYDRNTQIIKLEGGTPALAVWPDFCADDWFENFAIYSASMTTNILVAPILDDGTLLPKTTRNKRQEMPWIWSSRKSPIGFALYHEDTDSGNLVAVGVVLRRELQQPISLDPNRSWTVAVDFGTSNTIVMVNDETGCRVLTLRGRTTMLTDSLDRFKHIAISSRYPNEDVPPPFITLLTQGNAITSINGEDWRESLNFNSRFLFSLEQTRDIQQFVRDVKWGSKGGGADEIQLRSYLLDVTRYIACEARAYGVGKLSLAWSYPLALPEGAREAMTSFWDKVGTTFYESGEMKIAAMPGCSESEAICRYLASIKFPIIPVHAKALSIAVDIGGGSSDAGFWAETILYDRVSLKLAGNDLLPQLHSLNEFVPELYEICTNNQYLGEFQESFIERPAIMFNTLLTQAKGIDGKPCGIRDPRNHPVVNAIFAGTSHPYGEPPWLFVRSLIYLFFSGLAFYLGLHARRLSTDIFGEVNLYFGGLGSSLLAWVSGNREKIEEILSFAFKEGLMRDRPQNSNVSVQIFSPAINYIESLHPKEEVARGLLSDSLAKHERIKEGIQSKDTTIIGEIGWLDSEGKSLDWDAELTALQIYNLTPPPNHESGYMAQFITSVLPNYIEELSLDGQNLMHLRVESSRVQEYLRRSTFGNEILQPVFACELKAIVYQYIGMVLQTAPQV